MDPSRVVAADVSNVTSAAPGAMSSGNVYSTVLRPSKSSCCRRVRGCFNASQSRRSSWLRTGRSSPVEPGSRRRGNSLRYTQHGTCIRVAMRAAHRMGCKSVYATRQAVTCMCGENWGWCQRLLLVCMGPAQQSSAWWCWHKFAALQHLRSAIWPPTYQGKRDVPPDSEIHNLARGLRMIEPKRSRSEIAVAGKLQGQLIRRGSEVAGAVKSQGQ